MKTTHTTSRGFIALATALGILSVQASAQSLAVTSSTTVTYTGDTVPDTVGVDIPTYTSTGPDTPAVDNAGNLFFRGTFADSPLTLTNFNNAAYFYGSSRSTLKMGLRGNDPAPGQPVGYFLRNALVSSSALSSTVRVSPTGSYVWCPSNSHDPVLVLSTQSLFGGPFAPLAGQTLIQSQGDAAPGCAPETFAQSFSSITQALSGNNSNGHIYFQATLSGPTPDRFGIFEGLPGSVTLVQRSNQPANGIPNTFVSGGGTPFGSTVQINNLNQVFYEEVLSTTLGASPALINTDRALVAYTPPATYNVIVREGDNAPGTFGGAGPSFATFNAVTGDAWAPGQSGNNWTRSGKTFFSSELRGGDVVGVTNNVGLFLFNGAVLSLAARKGDAALPTDGTFSTFASASLMLNDSGQVCFQSTLVGGTVTTSNDGTIWAGTPGSLNLVAREGQIMPGTGGSACGNLLSPALSFNDEGRVLFTTTLTGGAKPGISWWLWDAVDGLRAVLFTNDVVEVAPSVFKQLTGVIASFTANNGDGAAMRFTHNGYIGFKATIAAGSGGGFANMVIRAPTVSTAYCFGDGSDTACPCGNPGVPGRGCDNTGATGGALLVSTGVASISTDTLVLNGASAVPFGPGLYYQGSTTANPVAPFGVQFGNGLRCAGGATPRLEIQLADVTGASQTTVAINVLGSCAAGDLRYYQLWYRDSPNFGLCTSGFNFSNGISLTWVP